MAVEFILISFNNNSLIYKPNRYRYHASTKMHIIIYKQIKHKQSKPSTDSCT